MRRTPRRTHCRCYTASYNARAAPGGTRKFAYTLGVSYAAIGMYELAEQVTEPMSLPDWGHRIGRATFGNKWKYVETLPSPPLGGGSGPGRRGPTAGRLRGPRAGPPRGPGGVAASPQRELYDILADPTESENLADKHPELFKDLAAAAHLIDQDAPRIPGGFMLRDEASFQRLDPLVGFPEDRGSHVLDRLDE